ncbi:MAG: FAD:protein FMN transferase [Bacteroidales bacterium]|nr:FAD:protein FMN transferase [Bacteroidales bacterium]
MNRNVVYTLVLLSFLISCSQPRELKPVKISGPIQGTYYVVTYYDSQGRDLQNEIESLLKDFDQTASMWVENSIISKINRDDPDTKPNKLFIDLFNKSKFVYENSDGAFDPTVGPLVNAWGFGFTDRLKVDQFIIDSLLPFVGFDKVKLENNNIIKSDPRIQFDLNAIAQGYSVDLLGKFLEKKGIKNYLVDIGGEVLAIGRKPKGESWKVGIERPSDNAEYGEGLKAIVNLENKAMATSGNYRKFYEEDGIRYSHTIDPKTGYPVQHSLLSVSVLADDCATADAWATAFMVSGLENSKELLHKIKGLEAYFIYSDQNKELQTYYTNGFQQILVEEID